MLKISHFWGGIFLIAGTSIGVAMLALPVSTTFMGFIPALTIFLICYVMMLISAYFFLDVNLAIKGESNLVTMAGRSLGNWGKILSWTFYLLLLYSLMAAYIAASGPLLQRAIHTVTGYALPSFLVPFSLPILFGGFIFLGTLGVDLINRFLMVGLAISYFLLIFFLPEHVQIDFLTHVDFTSSLVAFPIVLTSFGYHIIIPSLSTYMKYDRKQLRRVLFIGSLLPLFSFLIWEFLVMGIVPMKGAVSLVDAWQKGISATEPLTQILHKPFIRLSAHFFMFFAIVTSFLGVSLSLSDFLTDGLKIKRSWQGRILAVLLTFIPPLLFVFTYERGFIIALEYAGAFVAILLLFLPAMMAWRLKEPKFYQSKLGRLLLLVVIAFSFFLVISDLLSQWGVFKHLIFKYTQ
ncbi:MAG: tyrosine transporter [Ignavibacteriae bacterium]|nr:tyrosine transporter [Ignavibacteriota bacterium]